MTDYTGLRAALTAGPTSGPWFADHGKIGTDEHGIGEMDCPDDADLIVESVNTIRALLAERDRLTAALWDIVSYDGPLTAAEARRSWKIASAALGSRP